MRESIPRNDREPSLGPPKVTQVDPESDKAKQILADLERDRERKNQLQVVSTDWFVTQKFRTQVEKRRKDLTLAQKAMTFTLDDLRKDVTEEAASALLQHLSFQGEHWVWDGVVKLRDTPRIQVPGRGYVRVARLIYETLIGEIPKGKIIARTCDNLNCCRPSHLKVVSRSHAPTLVRF